MKKFIAMLLSALLFSAQPVYAMESAPREWDGKKVPKISLIVKKDMMAGYNVQIRTSNFKWAPNHASLTHIAGEGHAHIYVDGIKIGRVYGQWYHLNIAPLGLKAGKHIVLVNLNGNDHKPYAVKGKALEAISTITTE